MVLAGNAVAQLKWTVKAGLNYSNVVARDDGGNKANTASVPGVFLGLGTAVPLTGVLSIQPALVYAKRGFKQPGASHIGWGTDFEAKVSYLELPVAVVYHPQIGNGKLLVAAGPYAGYGTGGTWKTRGPVTVGDIMFEGKGDIAFQNDMSARGKGANSYTYARPWDYGLHFGLGYAFLGRYAASFEAQQGLADLQPHFGSYRPKSSVRNRSFALALSYRL